MKQKRPQHISKSQTNSISDEMLIKVVLLFIVFIHYVFTSLFNPGLKHYNLFDRDWGFDNITYLSVWLKYTVYFIIVLYILFFQQAGKKMAFINKILKYQTWNKRYYKLGLFLLISIISIAIFRGLTIKYDLLGDMRIRMIQTFNQEYLRNSYFTMYFLYHFYPVVNKVITLSHESYFSWMSYACGGIYVFFTLLNADLLGKTAVQKVILFFSQIFLGSMLYFVGYKEIYALPYLAVIIAVYLNLLYANGKIRFFWPLIITLALPAFHVLLAGFIPALAIVFVQRNKQIMPSWIKKIKTSHFLLLMLIALILLYKLALNMGISFELIPFKNTNPAKDFMTMFDYRHIWQYFNGLVLGAGMGFLVFIFMTKEVIRKKLKFDNTIWFLGSVSFFSLVIIFIINPIRGSGDWDVFAIPSLMISLCVFYSILHYYEKIQWINQFLWVLLIINLASAGSWIIVNHTDKSIDKIADMLLKDPGYYYLNSQPAVQLLAISYTENGLKDIGMKYYYENFKENYNDPRAHFNYAMRLIENKKINEGMDILKRLTDLFPYYPLSYNVLIQFYNENKNFNELYVTINKLFNAYIKNPAAFSRIPKEQLISYFSYLNQVRQSMKDTQGSDQVKKVLTILQKQ